MLLQSTAPLRTWQLFACYQAEIVGEAQLRSDGSIWAVEIFEEHRGQGLGRDLMVEVMRFAHDNAGFHSVWLYVHPNNEVAMNLYDSLGFDRTALTPRGWLRTRPLPFQGR